MTKPISRKMAVDCLLYRLEQGDGGVIIKSLSGYYLPCGICRCALLPQHDIEFDHIHADVYDGPHEYHTLRPVHAECHNIKTKADIKANAKVKRIIAKKPSRHPMKSSGRKIPSRPFQKRAPL